MLPLQLSLKDISASPYLYFKKAAIHHPGLIPAKIHRLSLFCLQADGYPARLKLSRKSPQRELFEVYFNTNDERVGDISTFIED
jgi:hypothetical protein